MALWLRINPPFSLPTTKQGRWMLFASTKPSSSNSSGSGSSSGNLSSSRSSKETPEWAKPDSDVPVPWANEKVASSGEGTDQDLPFFVYLIASSIVAIAAVGSVFEYANKNPIFGVIPPESPFYAPVLGFFAITGLPVSAFLWLRAIKLANKAAEDQDREDGYL